MLLLVFLVSLYLRISNARHHRSSVHPFRAVVGVAEVLVLEVLGRVVVAVRLVVNGLGVLAVHWSVVGNAPSGLIFRKKVRKDDCQLILLILKIFQFSYHKPNSSYIFLLY